MPTYCKLRIRIVLITLLCVFFFVACREPENESDTIPETAVTVDINVSISQIPETIYGNSLHKITYSWESKSDLEIESGLMVMVHFVNDENRIVFQDDHRLPDKSERINYTRNILVPLIPRPQNIRMIAGLYNPLSANRYYVRDSDGAYKNKVTTLSFRVTPPLYLDDLPEARITFGEGWHQREYCPNHLDSWRWISDSAHCLLKGADRDLILYIHGWVPDEVYEESFSVSLYLSGENLGEYTDLSGDFIINLQVTPEQIFPDETEELVIRTNQRFQPSVVDGSNDTRLLSVMIKQFYFN